MRNNLLHQNTTTELEARIQKLMVHAQPVWGNMTATEMLLHCNKIHEQLLSPSTSPKQKTSVKQYLIRLLVLYIRPHFPKNAQAPKGVRTKGLISDAAFEEEKKKFVEIIRRFPQHQDVIAHRHPYFGNLNTAQWGLAGYKHLDHHLRQFGV